MKSKRLELCGIGNAIVDVLVQVSEEQFSPLGYARDTFELVSSSAQQTLLHSFGHLNPQLVSGGSVGNSLIAFAQLGGKGAFLSCLGDDRYGMHYQSEGEELGLEIGAPLLLGRATGTCVVLITPDSHRTMRTSLGVLTEFGPSQVDAEKIRASEWLFIEGFLLANSEATQGAVHHAAAEARKSGTRIAVSFSDAFIINHFGAQLREVVSQADLIFTNESEACAFTGEKNVEAAVEKLTREIPEGVVTLGPRGVFVWHNGVLEHVPGFTCTPVDLTGAGDMLAGGYLYGITHGFGRKEAARAGCYLAMQVITRIGARLHGGTREYWNEALNLKG